MVSKAHRELANKMAQGLKKKGMLTSEKYLKFAAGGNMQKSDPSARKPNKRKSGSGEFESVKEASDIEAETSLAEADEVIEQGIEKGKICLEEETDKNAERGMGPPLKNLFAEEPVCRWRICRKCGGWTNGSGMHECDGHWWAVHLLRARQMSGMEAIWTRRRMKGWK